jgi:hypothetical protein
VKVEGLIMVRSSFEHGETLAAADALRKLTHHCRRRLSDGVRPATDIGQPAAWIAVGNFRLGNGRLAEHWDVIEDEATRATSISRLPMFSATSPS